MAAVLIYTTPTCPWCKKTKEFLKKKKIKYKELNVATDIKAQREMVEKSGQMGVPVLNIDGAIIVGYDPEEITAALKNSGKESTKLKRRKAIKNKGMFGWMKK